MAEWIAEASLRPFNTFGIDAKAGSLLHLTSYEEVDFALSSYVPDQTLILGGGSNVLFLGDWPGAVWLIGFQGIECIQENDQQVWVRVGAGVNWHQWVLHTIEKGWGGLENLSLIPGKVGAAPMQNIGAYGVEVGGRIASVDCVHLSTGKKVTLAGSDCGFGYRTSFFKTDWKNQYLILSVTFVLDKFPQVQTTYGAIQEALRTVGISPEQATIRQVSDAIIGIRQSKLPDPWVIGNAGSFFKNPIVPDVQAQALKAEFPAMVQFPDAPGWTKLAAGWLIEQAGWKGYRLGDAGVHAQQALVLVNHGQASGAEIFDLSCQIQASIMKKFGVVLEREVNLVGQPN